MNTNTLIKELLNYVKKPDHIKTLMYTDILQSENKTESNGR